MERAKYKMYTLYASMSLEEANKYSQEQRAKSKESEKKRGLALMNAERIEKLDAMTANYESMEDLLTSYTEEVYGEKVILYNPIIIVDKELVDRRKSYVINEIVFREDYNIINDIDFVRKETEQYLQENPTQIIIFRGMKEIYNNLRQKYNKMGTQQLIHNTLEIYFVNNNYKRSREAYFTLKRLDPERVRKNGIRR